MFTRGIFRIPWSSQFRNLRPVSKSASRAITSATSSTVSNEEIEKFNRIAAEWWKPDGDLRALHSMNKMRMELIRNGLFQNGQIGSESIETEFPLKGLKILDIGCGGGVLSQPLGRLGAHVIGLDPGKDSVATANLNLPSELKDSVQFVNSTLEEYAAQNPSVQFDGIIVSEVIEHVLDKNPFIAVATKLLKPSGSIFLTTQNRTAMSWLCAIVAAEYVFEILPRGTHEWKNFITPEELQAQLTTNGCSTRLVHGTMYNVWTNSWDFFHSTEINYAIHAVKDSSSEL